MTDDSVPPQRNSTRPLFVLLPVITVCWLVLAAVTVTWGVRIQRWQLAPGAAMDVSPRIAFRASDGSSQQPPKRYPAEHSIKFVTAFGGQVSALDALLGWLDPNVEVQTYKEHFGEQTPGGSKVIGFQAMYGAKQVAEYVAMKRLGLDAKFEEGIIAVADLVCTDDPLPDSACKKLKQGDTIVALDGVDTPTLSALAEQMKGRTAGQKVTITVAHGGKDPAKKANHTDVTVELMKSPDDPTHTIIGFVPADSRTVKLPFEVAISTSDIGGPSAGLAFTLALLDELTPGNLMGKGHVVATGTMNEDGTVGAIGALRQKSIAVRDAGATLFLVPAGQSDEELAAARAAAGTGVRIVRVATLDEALRVLAQNGGSGLPQK